MGHEVACEALFRVWEAAVDDVEGLRGDLARLEKRRRLAFDAYSEARGRIVGRIGVGQARVDDLRASLDLLGADTDLLDADLGDSDG
jgi:hypothetical protein